MEKDEFNSPRPKQRHTAYKVWINDILINPIEKEEGEFGSIYVSFAGNKVSRVNIMGIIVDKEATDSFVSLVVEDGSASINVKEF